ncbi:MAG: hypothetical protein KIS96_03195 [Bauldia sp.]|nr:hypothetical protein [Bauldia sp.]
MRILKWAGALVFAAGMTAGAPISLAQPVPDSPLQFFGDVPEQMWRWMQEMFENSDDMPLRPALPPLPDRDDPRPDGPAHGWTIYPSVPSAGMGHHGPMPAMAMAFRRGMTLGRIQAHMQTLGGLAFAAQLADRDRDRRLSEAEFMEAAVAVFRMLDLNRDRSLDVGDAAIALQLFGSMRQGDGPGIYRFDDWSDHQMPGVYRFGDSGGHGPGIHRFGDPDGTIEESRRWEAPAMQFTERHPQSGPAAGFDRGGPPSGIRAPFGPGFWGNHKADIPSSDRDHRHAGKATPDADPEPRDMRRGR